MTAPASLPVDTRMRIVPGVWGVGDVTGKGAFTHVAMYQARICVADILGHPIDEADYRALPTSDLHRSRDRLGRDDRSGGPEVRWRGQRDERADLVVGPGLDQQGRRIWSS